MTLSNSFKKYIPHSKDSNNNINNNNKNEHSFFHSLSLNSSKNNSSSSLSTNDPLFDINDNDINDNNNLTTNLNNLNLNLKSLPNDIQRKQRHNKPNLNLSSNSISTPKKISTSSNKLINSSINNVNSPNSNYCSSPIDIFERNVQNVELANNNNNNKSLSIDDNNSSIIRSRSYSNHSNNQSLNHSNNSDSNHSNSYSNLNNSYLMSNYRPRHLLSENFTSPVLDSTVELISTSNFNDTDVVEVPHSRPSDNLFKSYSSSNSNSDSHNSPRLSFSKKFSSPIIENNNKSRSSFSNLTSPLLRSKTYNVCTCCHNNNNNNLPEVTKSITNIASPLLSPKRKSISFYSFSDLLNYERMSSIPSSSKLLDLNKQNDIFDAQEEEDAIKDLKNAQLLENQSSLNDDSNNLLYHNCPKHGLISRRSTFQGCTEDSDAKIDEELTSDNNSNLKSNVSTPIYNVFNSSFDDDDDDDDDDNDDNNNNNNGNDDELDCSIQSWIPTDHELPSESSRTKSRRQSVVEELASLKSCTTNNSYFEDELKECTTHDSNLNSKIGVPVVNVCSANDYLNSRTRELRNSFVDGSINPKKIIN